jgi:hypothetical protein
MPIIQQTTRGKPTAALAPAPAPAPDAGRGGDAAGLIAIGRFLVNPAAVALVEWAPGGAALVTFTSGRVAAFIGDEVEALADALGGW